MDKKFGIKVISPNTKEFFQRYSTTGRLSVSLETGDNGFEKFKFNFQVLEDAGNGKKKQKESVQYYLDVDMVLAELCTIITNNNFSESLKKDLLEGLKTAKAGNVRPGKVFFTANGGTMPERTKSRNGNAEYRSLTLSRSNYNDKKIIGDEKAQKKAKEPKLVLMATKCDGKVYAPANTKQKLIIPIKSVSMNVQKLQNATTITMPLTYDDLKALAMKLYIEYSSYRTAQYIVAALGIDYKPTMTASEVKKEATAVTNPATQTVANDPTKPEDVVVVDEEIDFDFE